MVNSLHFYNGNRFQRKEESYIINQAKYSKIRYYTMTTLMQFIFVVILQSFVIVAHSLIITIIKKANLRSNRYYLIKMLSLSDIAQSISTIVFFVLVKAFDRQLESSPIMEVVTVFTYLMVCAENMSTYITIVVSFDRFVAVKYSLVYCIIVTKRKLNIIISIFFAYVLPLNFVLMRYTGDINTSEINSITKGLVFHLIAFHTFTSVTLITVGALTQQIRRNNEKRIHSIPSALHGTNKEQIDILRSLKNSLKDVVVLNYWTVFFLVLHIVFGIVGIVSSSPATIQMVIIIAGLSKLSNPFIYAFTQRDIRNWIKRFFCRNRMDDTMTN